MINGTMDHSLELHILEHKLRVSNVKKEAISLYTHALIKISLLPESRPRFFSFTETKDGYTIIVEDGLCKELPQSESIDMADLVWRVLTVSAGAFGSHKLTGISKIVKTVISPLADFKVSVLIISTYQSDYVLVKEVDLETAIRCLSQNFKIFEETTAGLEPVTLSIADRMAGMLNNTQERERKADEHRPIVHPFVCPANSFHVTSVDSQMLPSLTPIILDLMFYSRPQVQEAFESFFHISIVEGDISLVLDSNSLSRFPEGSLYTNTRDECWKMIRVGDAPLGFDESGVAAQIAEPLADAQMSTYYISTYGLGHTLESGIVAQLSEPFTDATASIYYICTFLHDHLLVPDSELDKALELLNSLRAH